MDAKTTKSPRRPSRQPKPDTDDKAGVAVKAAAPGPMLRPAGPSPSRSPRAESKTALITRLLTRSCGASLDELVAATGWQPHTTRAALTGLRKKGHTLTKDKVDGVTRYSIAAAAQQ